MKDDTNLTSYTGILGTNMEIVLNFYTRFPNAKQTIQNMLNINKKGKKPAHSTKETAAMKSGREWKRL